MAASTEPQPSIAREMVSERHLSEKIHGTATIKKFVQKAMGTVAAVLTAKALKQVWFPKPSTATTTTQSQDYKALETALIYCGFVIGLVPGLYYSAHKVKEQCTQPEPECDSVSKGCKSGCKRLAELWMVCLPMFFAWAFKDVVAELFKIFETSVEQIAITVSLLVTVAVLRSIAKIFACCCVSETGPFRGVVNHFVILMDKLGLAVGFAVNQLGCWIPRRVADHLETTLGFIVVNVAYYLIITLIVCPGTMFLWKNFCLREAPKPKPKPEVRFFRPDTDGRRADFKKVIEKVDTKFFEPKTPDKTLHPLEDFDKLVKGSLSFVYAWASLYTLDAFFFSYLMNCEIKTFGGKNDCSYQVYFGFSAVLSVILMRTAAMWSVEYADQPDSSKSYQTQMREKALPMIVGWEWATFCNKAIEHAQEDHKLKVAKDEQFSPDAFLVICMIGVWILVSLMYIAFDLERDRLNIFMQRSATFPGPDASLELGRGNETEHEAVEGPEPHAQELGRGISDI